MLGQPVQRLLFNKLAEIGMTHDDITSILEEAQAAGSEAAHREMLSRISQAKDKSKALDCCGGAILTLKVDGRSALGKVLGSYEHDQFKISKCDGGYSVHIPYNFEIIPPANGQDMYLWVTAERAAFEVIKRRMAVEGYVREYVD